MRFSTIATGFLSIAGQAAAAPTVEKRGFTAQQMVDNINTITQQSSKLQPVVSSIQSGNSIIAKRQFTNPFQPVITGFQALQTSIVAGIDKQQGTQPYNSADAQKVCAAFSRMTTTQSSLMKIMVYKSGLLEGIFLGPVAATLRSFESAIDTYAFGVLDAVPGCLESATANKATLDTEIGKAVCAYTPAGSLGRNLFC